MACRVGSRQFSRARSGGTSRPPVRVTMDHAWYTLDVLEMRVWRRAGAVVWSFGVATLFGLLYITVMDATNFAAVFSAGEWAKKVGLSVAFALTQLPPSMLTTVLLKPSLAPLRVAGGPLGGGVDPWGVFAPPGSEQRWAGARAPPHLFPAGFQASRWVSHRPPHMAPDEMARDALGAVAVVVAHVVSGAAACALFADAAHDDCCDHGDDANRHGDGHGHGDSHHGHSSHGHHSHGHHHQHDSDDSNSLWGVVTMSPCVTRAARYGAVLGLVAASHYFLSGAQLASFQHAPRPRWFRVKASIPTSLYQGGVVACVSVIVATAVAVLFPLEDNDELESIIVADTFSHPSSLTLKRAVLLPFMFISATLQFLYIYTIHFLSTLGYAPLGAVVAGTWFSQRKTSEHVQTERYHFRPQSLGGGNTTASGPLLASLVNETQPWVQHLGFLDLYLVCTHGGGGRRELLVQDGSGNAGAYSPTVAAALAPILSVTSAMRAALHAAERAERDAIGGGVTFLKGKKEGNSSVNGGGVRLRSVGANRASLKVFNHVSSGANGETLRDESFGYDRRFTNDHAASHGHLPGTDSVGQYGQTQNGIRSRVTSETVDAAAWAATADEWGMPHSVSAPSGNGFHAEHVSAQNTKNTYDTSQSVGAREVTAGFLEDEAMRRELTSRRHNDHETSINKLRAQMETPTQAASREALLVLAAHGQLARWGCAAVTSLCVSSRAGRDANDDASFADTSSTRIQTQPTCSAVFRVLVAATRAAEACASAGVGGGGDAITQSGSVRFRMTTAPRVPELRSARPAAQTLADTFRTSLYKFVDVFGEEEVRRMMGEKGVGGDVGDGDKNLRDGNETSDEHATPKELETLIESVLRWE